MTNKKQWLTIILVLLALATLLAILLSQKPQQVVNEKPVLDESQILLSNFDFNSLQLTDVGAKFQGYFVLDILTAKSVDADSIDAVYFVSSDGAGIAISANEIKKKQVALVPQEGSEHYRLILPQDPFRNRWLKNITMLEIEQ